MAAVNRATPFRTSQWKMVSVGDLGEFVNGYAFKPSQWTDRGGRPIIRIQNLTDQSKPFNRFEGELPEKYLVHTGDLLVSWSASLGAFVWQGEDAWLNQHIFRVTPNESLVDPTFLHFLMKAEIREIAKSARGSTMKHVTRKTFRQHTVALPALDEQRHIAEVLSTLATATHAQSSCLGTVRDIWRAALDAVLGDGADQSLWSVCPFPEAIDYQEGPGIMARDFRSEGVPLIRLAGLTHSESVLEGCNFLDPAMVGKRWSHFRLEPGDTLLSTSASLGRVAVVGDDAVGAIAYTGIIRMRPRDGRVLSEFIPCLLHGPDFQRQVEEAGIGTVMRHFGPSHLKSMRVLLPPVTEQKRITRVLQTIRVTERAHVTAVERSQAVFDAALNELMAAPG